MDHHGSGASKAQHLMASDIAAGVRPVETAERIASVDVIRGVTVLHYRRTLWLITFGLVHAYLIWAGDILFFYGVVGLALYPLRRLSSRVLITAAAVLMLLQAPKFFLEGKRLEGVRDKARAADAARAAGQALNMEQEADRKAWEEEQKKLAPDAAGIEKEIADHRGGYFRLLKRRMGEVPAYQSDLFYRIIAFDVAAMMLLGMALMKLGVFSAARSFRAYAWMAFLGYAIGAPLNLWVGRQASASGFDPIVMNLNFAWYDVGRMSVACRLAGVHDPGEEALGHAGHVIAHDAVQWFVGGAGPVGKRKPQGVVQVEIEQLRHHAAAMGALVRQGVAVVHVAIQKVLQAAALGRHFRAERN